MALEVEYQRDLGLGTIIGGAHRPNNMLYIFYIDEINDLRFYRFHVNLGLYDKTNCPLDGTGSASWGEPIMDGTIIEDNDKNIFGVFPMYGTDLILAQFDPVYEVFLPFIKTTGGGSSIYVKLNGTWILAESVYGKVDGTYVKSE